MFIFGGIFYDEYDYEERVTTVEQFLPETDEWIERKDMQWDYLLL